MFPQVRIPWQCSQVHMEEALSWAQTGVAMAFIPLAPEGCLPEPWCFQLMAQWEKDRLAWQKSHPIFLKKSPTGTWSHSAPIQAALPMDFSTEDCPEQGGSIPSRPSNLVRIFICSAPSGNEAGAGGGGRPQLGMRRRGLLCGTAAAVRPPLFLKSSANKGEQGRGIRALGNSCPRMDGGRSPLREASSNGQSRTVDFWPKRNAPHQWRSVGAQCLGQGWYVCVQMPPGSLAANGRPP